MPCRSTNPLSSASASQRVWTDGSGATIFFLMCLLVPLGSFFVSMCLPMFSMCLIKNSGIILRGNRGGCVGLGQCKNKPVSQQVSWAEVCFPKTRLVTLVVAIQLLIPNYHSCYSVGKHTKAGFLHYKAELCSSCSGSGFPNSPAQIRTRVRADPRPELDAAFIENQWVAGTVWYERGGEGGESVYSLGSVKATLIEL